MSLEPPSHSMVSTTACIESHPGGVYPALIALCAPWLSGTKYTYPFLMHCFDLMTIPLQLQVHPVKAENHRLLCGSDVSDNLGFGMDPQTLADSTLTVTSCPESVQSPWISSMASFGFAKVHPQFKYKTYHMFLYGMVCSKSGCIVSY